jgi:coiled-coil domain-containing protein 61
MKHIHPCTCLYSTYSLSSTPDIEEITLKAGNFKKFEVFLQMLASAFDNDSESVYVDVLTYSDLEMLKARKANPAVGADADSSSAVSIHSGQSKSQTKRYVILTYRGEFDRVHYPLPLAYEDTPNGDALKRTIRRLRKRVDELDHLPQSDLVGEKDLRKIIANLRQENTELKHRIRRQGSGGNSMDEDHVSGLTRTVTDLQSMNSKQRKEIDGLKKELARADATYQKYRTDAQKEVNKWKTKSMEPRRRGGDSPSGGRDSGYGGGGGSSSSSSSSSSVSSSGGDRNLTNSLRRRVTELERELRLEKLASSRGYQGSSPGGSGGFGSSSRGSVAPPRRAATPPMSRPVNRGTPSSAGSARSHRTAGSSGYGQSTGTRSARGRSSSPNVAGSGGAYRKATVGSSNSAYRGHVPATARSRSISPGFGSSVGGRFDPTAYHRAKEEKKAQSLATRQGYGVSPGSGRKGGGGGRGHSGYDSQDSESAYRAPRRVSSRPHSSPALSSSASGPRPKKKVSASAGSSSAQRKSGSGSGAGGGVETARNDRKVKRSTEKKTYSKTTMLHHRSESGSGGGASRVGSFPVPVSDDYIPHSSSGTGKHSPKGGPGADLDGSLVEDSPPLSRSPVHSRTSPVHSRSPLHNNSSSNSINNSNNNNNSSSNGGSSTGSPNKSREEIQAIDARIASLQQYLESARTGLLSDD